MTTRQGKLRNNESFCSMIENLGDAYEAAEECYGMVWYLAARLAAIHAGEQGQARYWVKAAEEHYQDGLRLGGVQRAR
jgi:hypothetical protein